MPLSDDNGDLGRVLGASRCACVIPGPCPGRLIVLPGILCADRSTERRRIQSAGVEASINASATSENTMREGGLDMVDDNKVTVKELPDGKWGCFLHVPGYDQPFDLGKQFKSEERAELWLNVSEATTAIEMVLAKCRVR